jgi:hypothetical protein
MPNPHHRKKHKHFQPPPHTRKQQKNKGGVASILAIFCGIIGLAIVYFAISGSLLWIIAGTVIAAVIGYLLGLRIDKGGEKTG